MATVVKAMANPDSGLEIRDRMWLKITIPNAFIGEFITKPSIYRVVVYFLLCHESLNY